MMKVREGEESKIIGEWIRKGRRGKGWSDWRE